MTRNVIIIEEGLLLLCPSLKPIDYRQANCDNQSPLSDKFVAPYKSKINPQAYVSSKCLVIKDLRRAIMEQVSTVVKETAKKFHLGGIEEALMIDSPPRGYSLDVLIPSHKALTDEELIRRFTENDDEDAFNEIVNRYTDTIYRIALRIINNPSDAEEVLQEVFLTLIKKLDTFREESKFSTWLYRVVVNTSYMYQRAERKKNESEMSLPDYVPYDQPGRLNGIQNKDWSYESDVPLLSTERMEIIEKAINELPEYNRVVFLLRDVEGLTNEEVAKVLGISLPAVKSRVRRARLFLRDSLSDYFYEWREK
jgi:RNA polymerase sigma-70 factor (ECF subfamily)